MNQKIRTIIKFESHDRNDNGDGMKSNKNCPKHLKQKRKIKKIIFGMGAAAFALALLVLTTSAFLCSFQYLDAKRAQKPQSGVPIASSSAPARQSSASQNDFASSSLPSGLESSSTQSEAGSSSQTGPDSSSAAEPSPQLNDWRLVLVNYDHKMPDAFENKIVTAFGMQMDSRMVQPYTEMRNAAQKDSIPLWISSAYRSPEKQQTLFEQEIKNYSKAGAGEAEAAAEAERSVARPGYSEHNTGLALDLNGVREDFEITPAFHWLKLYAADYGFILRYPKDKQAITKIKYEPWHYRYVGVEHAKKMAELHMCLEEYVDYLRKNPDSGN
jgi:D-alanyl-D-alanine carboxypeptidase